jgi:hypothetical protein
MHHSHFTTAAVNHQRNQVVAALLKRHVPIGNCAATEVIKIIFLSVRGVRKIAFNGGYPLKGATGSCGRDKAQGDFGLCPFLAHHELDMANLIRKRATKSYLE